jgi:uncharacterized membrane protein
MKLYLGAAFILSATQAAFAAPTLTFYGDTAYAVSADGQYVVGQTDLQGFRYNIDGSVTHLSFPASDVNGDGSVVVGGYLTLSEWVNGTTTTLPAPAAGTVAETSAHIAPYANVVAAYSVSPFQAFETDGLSVTLLPQPDGDSFAPSGVSGDGTKIVGPTNYEYAGGTLTPVAGLEYVTSISPDGNVITGISTDGQIAFVDQNGVHSLTSYVGQANAASDNGVIVGSAAFPDSSPAPSQAFLWTQATGAVELNQLVNVPDGWFLTSAFDVSADGSVIVGQAYTDNGAVATGFIISGLTHFAPVSEPSTYGLAGASMLVVAMAFRRKFRRRESGSGNGS